MSWKQLFELYCLLNLQLDRFERCCIGSWSLGVPVRLMSAWRKHELSQDLKREVQAMMEGVPFDEC